MVTKLLLTAWAPKTLSNYGTYTRKWFKYCSTKNISDLYEATYKDGKSFLAVYFYKQSRNYGVTAAVYLALSTELPETNRITFG